MRFEKLNNIPVRTARIQDVNNISLELNDVKIDKFENIKIVSEVSGVEISKLSKNDSRLVDLKYAVSKELLNEANESFTNGLVITVPENSKATDSIVIEFTMDKANNTLVDNIIIDAKKDSKANIIIKYVSDKELIGYHNGVCRVFAEENATIKVSKVNLLSNKVNNFDSNLSEAKDNAIVDFIAVDLGGENTVSNYEGILLGDNSKSDVSGVYIGTDNEKIDLNYILTIKGRKTESNMDVKGALRDKALKIFKGTLDFKRGAKQSKGAEEEYCMLLSEKARSKSIPLLLCDEEDVSGEHAAASGSIDENKLFYLMSRGISYDEARILIINAAFNPIIYKLENEEIQNEILGYIKERLV